MIIDTIENGKKYASLHPLFAEAFEYLKTIDLLTIEPGTYILNEGLKSIVSDKMGKTAAESIAKFECHNANIDIQVCIRGKETIAWKPRQDCVSPVGEYNIEKDVLFYTDAPDMSFDLKGGQFVIFYPEDVHAPMIGDDMIKKLVMKVKI